MDFVELFKDSLVYPTKGLDKLLILGLLLIIGNIIGILELFGISLLEYLDVNTLLVLSLILFLVINLILHGYTLSIIRKTINNVSGNIPEFEWFRNILDGIKVFVLIIVYFIIPVIVTILVIHVTGAWNYMNQLMPYTLLYGSASAPQSLAFSAGLSFIIVFLVAAIFVTFFGLLYLVAKAVLADTESLNSAINMPKVFKKIGQIKWRNYILWVILFAIIWVFIWFLANVVSIIPIIGVIIAILFVQSFAHMFAARTLGLIYNESKE